MARKSIVLDTGIDTVLNKVKPNTHDWVLISNTKELVLYTSKKLRMNITLSKYNDVWRARCSGYSSGLIEKIGDAPLKSEAISQAKIFMAQHPAPSDNIPIDLHNSVVTRGPFKNPERVTQFAKRR